MPLTAPWMDIECRGTLLRDAAEALDEAGLRLCVLHGSDRYPNVESDLDAVCVEPRRIPEVLAARRRSVLVQAIEHERDAYYYVLHGRCPRGSAFVALDVSADYRRNGRVFYAGSQLARSCRPWREIDRPSPDVEFTCYLIKKLLKADLQAEHAGDLSRIYALDPPGCERELGRFFPDPVVRLLVHAASQGDWDEVRARIAELRRGLLFRVGVRAPWRMVRYWLDDAIRRIRRILRPTGMVVLVDGADGSLVAAIMDRIESVLAPAFRRTVRPPLNQDSGARGIRERARMYGHLYWLLVHSTLVLLGPVDDADIRGRRVRGRRPSARLARMLRLMPQSWTLNVYVGASHHSPATERRGRPGWYVVDGSRPLDEIITEVTHAAVKHMAQRTARRLGVGQPRPSRPPIPRRHGTPRR